MSDVSVGAQEKPVFTEDSTHVMLLDEIADPDLILPMWEASGHAEVDQVLETLQSLDPDHVHTHAEVLSNVHGRLYELMSQLDR